jgi:hypothetical protein
METALITEAAPPPDRDAQRSDRVVTMVASTDPARALINIAEQRAAQARQKRLRRGSLAVLAFALAAGALAITLAQGHSPAAARVGAQAPRAGAARAKVAPLAPVATSDVTMSVTPVAVDDPAARCQGDFQAHQWRAASESCGAAFDAAPSPALAMRIAHARWARGDAAGGAEWGRRALELGTKDADAYVLIGNAARAAGDNAAAVAAYRSYLEQAPRGWHAARLRGELRKLGRPAAAQTHAAR